ncbi:MAG TPA: DUF5130 family protein [Mycobacteriales bacterium]|nr:DUF5130 family protein [Mycobacteriales bacterium]
MANGELRTESHVDEEIQARTDTVSGPGGDLGPDANAQHAAQLARDSEVSDRSAVVVGRTPGPFTPRQLSRLDEALTLSSRETGLDFSVYVGALDEPTRAHAERLHAGLPRPAEGVLLAVSPQQRVLHIVTGEQSTRRLPDRACSLAALSMRASLSVGDLVGALVNGLRMLSDQAGRANDRSQAPH